jgi:hypothetical protein
MRQNGNGGTISTSQAKQRHGAIQFLTLSPPQPSVSFIMPHAAELICSAALLTVLRLVSCAHLEQTRVGVRRSRAEISRWQGVENNPTKTRCRNSFWSFGVVLDSFSSNCAIALLLLLESSYATGYGSMADCAPRAKEEYDEMVQHTLIQPLIEWAMSSADPVIRCAGVELAFAERGK